MSSASIAAGPAASRRAFNVYDDLPISARLSGLIISAPSRNHQMISVDCCYFQMLLHTHQNENTRKRYRHANGFSYEAIFAVFFSYYESRLLMPRASCSLLDIYES